jgi:hypothetical protein
MAEDRYNIVFSGELQSGADAAATRQKLAGTFRLDAAQLDNLFSGRPVVVKRDVDLLTATRFQQAFLAAGARADIESATVDSVGERTAAPEHPPGKHADASVLTEGPLALAAAGAPLEEIVERGPPQHPDTSALSLVTADSWDLSDCAPPPVPTPEYDLDGISLEPLDARRPDDGQ